MDGVWCRLRWWWAGAATGDGSGGGRGYRTVSACPSLVLSARAWIGCTASCQCCDMAAPCWSRELRSQVVPAWVQNDFDGAWSVACERSPKYSASRTCIRVE